MILGRIKKRLILVMSNYHVDSNALFVGKRKDEMGVVFMEEFVG